MTNFQRVGSDDGPSMWPYADMLIFGYFGSDTSTGRRHRNRTIGFLALFLVSGATAAYAGLPWAARLICAVAVPMAWAGIVWSYVKYLSELDELNRLIQLEAAALSYGAVLVLGSIWFALGALGIVREASNATTQSGGHAPSVLPNVLFMSLLIVEPLRGIILVLLARSRR